MNDISDQKQLLLLMTLARVALYRVLADLSRLQHLLRLLLRVTDENIPDMIRDQEIIVLQHHKVIACILQILQRFLKTKQTGKHDHYECGA